jgi:hypothetical protein
MALPEVKTSTIILVVSVVLLVGAILVFGRKDLSAKPADQPVAALTDQQANNPDKVIDIKVQDFAITSGQTEFRSKQGGVTKLQFKVDGEEEIIHLTGPGATDIFTEADGTSPGPSSIYVANLKAGTYELSSYAEPVDADAKVKHVIGKVIVE